MTEALEGVPVLLFNPPGRRLLRGEGRADALLDKAAVSWLYPPMNLAYAAACLRKAGASCAIRDYPATGESLEDLAADARRLGIKAAVANVNASAILEDCRSLLCLREAVPLVRLAVIAPFLSVHPGSEDIQALLSACDAALVVEYPELVVPLLSALLSADGAQAMGLREVPGVCYRAAPNGEIARTGPAPMRSLENLPLPARDLLDNGLYVRPDTGRPQGLVQVSRGCPSFCTFCLTPSMTGTQFLQRSVEGVLAEVRECKERFGLDQIFFRADTFTMNRRWVLAFCEGLSGSGLGISWCANSRADRIDPELARRMRQAGCWLLSFGFESGSAETLARTRKGATAEQNLEAARVAREAGILVFGQFVVGFPWESASHLDDTLGLIRRMRPDFLDVQFLVPYPGTPVWEETPAEMRSALGTKQEGGLVATLGGLAPADLVRYRKRMLRSAYLAPDALWRKFKRIRSARELANYARYGLKFLAGGYF